MNRKILIARPRYDDVTMYLHYWGGVVLKDAVKKAVDAFDLSGSKCTRAAAEGYINRHNPGFLVFHAHGDERAIYGNKSNGDEEVIVGCGDNDGILSGRIVYSISCSSARVLGRECGSRAFVGYKEDFVFFYTPSKVSNPSVDNVATPCLESTTQIPLAIIKGSSVQEAVIRARKCYIKHIKSLLGSKEIEAPYVIQSLVDNLSNLEVIGDSKVTF